MTWVPSGFSVACGCLPRAHPCHSVVRRKFPTFLESAFPFWSTYAVTVSGAQGYCCGLRKNLGCMMPATRHSDMIGLHRHLHSCCHGRCLYCHRQMKKWKDSYWPSQVAVVFVPNVRACSLVLLLILVLLDTQDFKSASSFSLCFVTTVVRYNLRTSARSCVL